jgi:TetR/AcrR family transcriptional regulator, transcriptional repressor of bet genes
VKRRRQRKFQREPAAVRRQALVAATLACLRRHGHAGVSVRRISAAAGVSVGLINHHFPGKAGLVAAAYAQLATSLLAAIRQEALADGMTPRQRLHRFFVASFRPQILDPRLFNVWLVFWSMVSHSPAIRAVHDRTYGEYRATLEGLLRELRALPDVAPFRLRTAAIGLSALLDGLWIESSLSPGTIRPTEAIALCEAFVDALCAGTLARSPRRHVRRGASSARARHVR